MEITARNLAEGINPRAPSAPAIIPRMPNTSATIFKAFPAARANSLSSALPAVDPMEKMILDPANTKENMSATVPEASEALKLSIIEMRLSPPITAPAHPQTKSQ